MRRFVGGALALVMGWAVGWGLGAGLTACSHATMQAQERLVHQEALELACIDSATTLQESKDCRAKVRAAFADAGSDR